MVHPHGMNHNSSDNENEESPDLSHVPDGSSQANFYHEADRFAENLLGTEGFDDFEATTSERSSDRKGYERNNRRIILQRFTIYNSSTTMYIVGSNAKESLFRIIEITSDSERGTLSIIEEKNFFYTRNDVIELMKGLNESIEGGIHKIAHAYGLLGFIRFTGAYYLSIITKCSQVALVGGHFVYHVDETKLIPLSLEYRRPNKYSDEEKLLSIFKYLDLGKTFYFSYTYDLTNTLQTNLLRLRQYDKGHRDPDNHKTSLNVRFVWNGRLLRPVNETDIATYEWFQPIVHGFIDQASISIYGRRLFITIIARRSHHFAGARFLKRGVNHKGDVANEVETEQIVNDMLTTSFHSPEYGLFANPRFTSYVQHRGSIPLYWTQDLNRLPKPPIEINLSDPFYQSSAQHFDDLMRRYGLPIIIVNLIKTKEKHPRELKLSRQFINCVTYLNQFLPEPYKLQYHSFDMSKHSKKNADVIGPLESLAKSSIEKTGFFHNGKTLGETKIQRGIIRTNCIDCLDRTNAAQFIICKEALYQQLKSLGFLASPSSLDYDSDLINILTEMFHDHGDTIAVQYGGSNLVNTMDSYRRINQWSSHTIDILNSIKRIYSNSFIDVIRQEAINLFLGNYIYSPEKPKLWELQNDYYLHNQGLAVDFSNKVSYIRWYNENAVKSLIRSENDTLLFPLRQLRLDINELSDNWFNECYIPKKFQSFTNVYQFNMNSNARYFPNSTNEAKSFDYSPFGSRRGKYIPKHHNQHRSHSVDNEMVNTTTSETRLIESSATNVRDFGVQPNENNFSARILCSSADASLFSIILSHPLRFLHEQKKASLIRPIALDEKEEEFYRTKTQPPSFGYCLSTLHKFVSSDDTQHYISYLEDFLQTTVFMTTEQYV